jgi:hypothetical protein
LMRGRAGISAVQALPDGLWAGISAVQPLPEEPLMKDMKGA